VELKKLGARELENVVAKELEMGDQELFEE
jgi:hypothetical protein